MELTIDPAKWRSRRGMGRLLDALGASDGLTRYVGGAVRDDLLDLRVSDVDLATKLRPTEVIQRLEAHKIKAVPTGIEHGTITAVSDGIAYEVTTLRRDVSTDGRRATVAFTSAWEEDAARRDFTINALFADPETGAIFDYFGGLEDLLARHIRFIGDPLSRIAEDHLRILRYFRFHARFGESPPDEAALDACTQRANDLMALSRERIADEMLKLLSVANPAPTISLMLERNILRPVLPEISVEQLPALNRLIISEQVSGISPDGLRRLAALLPPQSSVGEAVAARLKLSTRARKRLVCVLLNDAHGSAETLAYRRGTECAIDRLLIEGRAAEAKRIEHWNPPRLPLGGGVLIARGLPEGPIVAKTLRKIEDWWVEEGFPEGEALERIVSSAIAQMRSS